MLTSRFFKQMLVLVIAGVVSFSVAAADNGAVGNTTATEVSGESFRGEENLCNMGRGIVNIATCWLEIPRCIIYHNSQVPVMGTIVGICEGAGFTVVRAFSGVMDFISFGFMSDSIYNSTHEFKEWVWDSRWQPEE